MEKTLRLKAGRAARLAVAGAALVAASGCAGMPDWWPFGPDARANARQVLVIYDIGGMLDQVAPIIIDSLAANLPAGVQEPETKWLQARIQAVYDPARLLEQAALRLAALAEAREREGALDQAAERLDTALALRMVQNEKAAATQAFADGFAAFLQQPVDPANAPRMQRMRDLSEALHLVDLQIAFNVGMLRGMAAARNAVVDESMRTSPEILQRMSETTRRALRSRLVEQLPILLFYAHRDVAGEDLERYLTTQTTPALAWTNNALAAVLEATLEDAAARLARPEA